jgi:hypothetical protein
MNRPPLIPTVMATNADDAPLFYAGALGVPLAVLRSLVRAGHVTVRLRGDHWAAIRISSEGRRLLRLQHAESEPAAVWPAEPEESAA